MDKDEQQLDLSCSAEGHECKLVVDYHEPIEDEGEEEKANAPHGWFTLELEGENISLSIDDARRLAAFLIFERK